MTQDEFEQLIGRQDTPQGVELPRFTVIYFTATWCGACRRLDVPALEAAMPGVNWLKCDVDQNNYTPGFCGVRSIPTFLIVADKKIIGPYSNNQNDAVLKWVGTEYEAWQKLSV
jgi:thioredoxin 1